MIKLILVLLTLWSLTGCILRNGFPGKHGVKGKNGMQKRTILVR
jgi:hypothetical protein